MAPLLGPVESVDGLISISSIDPIHKNFCVQVDFTVLTGRHSPLLYGLKASYHSDQMASVSFDVQVTTGTIVSQTIDNTATISTITPEISLKNNSDNYQMTILGTDLNIRKTVDLGAAHDGDILTYTIDYKNE